MEEKKKKYYEAICDMWKFLKWQIDTGINFDDVVNKSDLLEKKYKGTSCERFARELLLNAICELDHIATEVNIS